MFIEAFKDYINECHGPAFRKFSESVYSGAINFNLIAREDYVDFDEVPADNKILFFDVNVLVALLCETDDTHDAVQSMVDRSRELGYSLYYLHSSADELGEFIRMSKKEATGFKESGGNSDVIESQFVKDWLSRSISWENYKSEVLNSWVSNIELMGFSEFDGEALNEDFISQFEEMFLKVEQIKKQQVGSLKRSDKLEHDARLLAQVSEMQSKATDDITAGPYVITRDRSVSAVGQLDRDDSKHGSALHPRRFLDYVLAFTSVEITTEERRDIVTALVKSSVKEYHEPDLDEFSELIRARTGLEHGDKEVIKRILVESPQESDLRKHLENNDGVEADNVAMDVLNNEDLLKELSDEWGMREKMRSVRESMEDAKEERDELEEELENTKREKEFLQNLVQQNQSGPRIQIDASSHATTDVDVVQEFNTEINEFISTLDTRLDSGFEDSEIPTPPEDNSDVENVRQWLTTTATVLSSTDNLSGMSQWAAELLEKLPSVI